jgi:hypothetical protein
VTTPDDFRRVVDLYFPRDGWMENPPPHWLYGNGKALAT